MNPFAYLFEYRKNKIRQDAINAVAENIPITAKTIDQETPENTVRPFALSELLNEKKEKKEEQVLK